MECWKIRHHKGKSAAVKFLQDKPLCHNQCVGWAARRSHQSTLKEISPGCSLEGLMRKLKLQSFGHLMRRVDSLETNSDAGRDWAQEEKGTTEDEMAGWHHGLEGRESE